MSDMGRHLTATVARDVMRTAASMWGAARTRRGDRRLDEAFDRAEVLAGQLLVDASQARRDAGTSECGEGYEPSVWHLAGSDDPSFLLVVAVTRAEHLRAELDSTRAVSDSRRCDVEHLRCEVDRLARRLAAHEGRDETLAPPYPGHAWTPGGPFGQAPYHLCRLVREPYPVPSAIGLDGKSLPDIEMPEQRTVCGKAKWAGTVRDWPAATDVCPGCAAAARDVALPLADFA